MHSETPDIIPITSSLMPKLLTDSELETLKQGTLRLLDEVGVHLPSRRAPELLADHGAKVDMNTEVVRMPPEMVLRAMSTAPRSFLLAGREERFDLLLDGSHSYVCTDGTAVRVVDSETREIRASRKTDIERMARVCDALPLISFFWPFVSAQDYGLTAPLHECHAGLTNTLKHVRGGTTVLPRLAPYMVEMATTVAGSEEARRRRPPICANICSIAPLSHDSNGIETALIYAEAGIPTSFMAMPTMGSTAPATPVGALVQGDAEVVSAMVLMQTAFPGAPVFHAVFTSLMDPRTGGYISEAPMPSMIMATQLAHAWNVPSLGGARLSGDAPTIGWQSGAEAGLGAALLPMFGGEICGLLGLIGGATILCPEDVILGHEMCQQALELLGGFRFDAADMALDVITDVGPRGHFLKQKHTRIHIRDFRLSPISGQRGADGTEQDPREVALQEFRQLEKTHHPRLLAQHVLDEMDRILAAAEREAERIS
jgi:trimethylamine--corrinoid protein Co-methyltransferase